MTVSVIIPTYGRPASVVLNTIRSIQEDSENARLVREIIVIDQNQPKLELSSPNSEYAFIEMNALQKVEYEFSKKSVIQIHGLKPSVTTAKNFGISVSTGKHLVFFDDDVTVHIGTIQNFCEQIETHPQAGFFAGREIVDSALVTQSALKDFLRSIANKVLSCRAEEEQYKINGQYVGRIFPNSLMVSNYSLQSPELIRIDGARGCIWAAQKSTVLQAGAFDPNFKGTALREETDLYLRIKKIFPDNFFTSKSVVTHHRQLGGCENLAVNMNRLNSKFENELYFQKKHFSHRSAIFFLIRLAPLALGAIKETRGKSLISWLAFSYKAIF